MRAATMTMATAVIWTTLTQSGTGSELQRLTGKATEPTPLTIYIHNFSEFEDATINEAARATEEIFRRAGVATRVVNDPMVVTNGERRPAHNFSYTATDLVANILTREMAAALRVDMSVLGVAPGAGIRGRNLVHVFGHRVSELRRFTLDEVQKGGQAWIVTESRILGYAIAHEVGHVLLNMARHPDVGIMRGSWSLNELRAIAANTLRFTPSEAGRLREEARRRAAIAAREE